MVSFQFRSLLTFLSSAKAKDAGWTETTAFDYAAYEASGGNNADWRGAAKVYEWNDDFGDVAPAVPELEEILFGSEHQMRKGAHIDNISHIEVQLEGPVAVAPVRKVSDIITIPSSHVLIRLLVRGRWPPPGRAPQH